MGKAVDTDTLDFSTHTYTFSAKNALVGIPDQNGTRVNGQVIRAFVFETQIGNPKAIGEVLQRAMTAPGATGTFSIMTTQ
jgi:hypothetical protein